jgi:hypothetical protein
MARRFDVPILAKLAKFEFEDDVRTTWTGTDSAQHYLDSANNLPRLAAVVYDDANDTAVLRVPLARSVAHLLKVASIEACEKVRHAFKTCPKFAFHVAMSGNGNPA